MRALGIALAFGGLLVSACSPEKVRVGFDSNLRLAPPVAAARPVIAVGSFADKRGQGAYYLGTIRGHFGEPAMRVVTDEPIGELVRKGFGEGLAARGLLSDRPDALYTLSGVIAKFDCNRYVRQEADAELALVLTQTSTGNVLMSRTVKRLNRSDRAPDGSPDRSASVDDLRNLAQQTLQEVVDQALDNPELLNLVRPP